MGALKPSTKQESHLFDVAGGATTFANGPEAAHRNTYVASEVAPEQWEQLLAMFPGHSVFHTLPWLETIETVHGAKARLLRVDASAMARDGEDASCVAIWPVFTTRKGPLRILGSPVPGWCTAYMGPLFRRGCCVQESLEAFLGHPILRGGSYFSCKVLVDRTPVNLSRFRFVEVERLDTYCLDLTQPLEALWDNLKSECRTQIRKAWKMNVQVQHERDDSFIDEYWAMALETFGNCNIKPLFPRQFLEELWRRLHPGGRVHVLSAIHEGRRIGALVLPLDDETMYYWSGASYLRCRGIPAHNLLHWEAIRLGHRLGLRRYDFVSTLGGGGRFKKTFGPRAIHMATHWERTSSGIVRMLRHGYERYISHRQRLFRWEHALGRAFSRLFTLGMLLTPIGV